MKTISPENITRSPWRYQAEPFEIVKDVYYVGNTSVSVHLIDTGEGLLLVDTAYMQSLYLLLESVRKLGFDPADIRWILHTHAHIDHFGGTRQLVELHGCKTWLPKADLELMTTRSELNYVETFGQPYEPPYDCYFETDETVEPGDVLTFGRVKVECFSAAGHTPGTMAYVFHLPCGMKAAMHGGIGLNTLKSDYARRYGLGDAWRRAYGESLDRLEGLKADVVLSNHPHQLNVFEKQARRTADFNPFVDREEWGRFIRSTREKYLELLEKDPL